MTALNKGYLWQVLVVTIIASSWSCDRCLGNWFVVYGIAACCGYLIVICDFHCQTKSMRKLARGCKCQSHDHGMLRPCRIPLTMATGPAWTAIISHMTSHYYYYLMMELLVPIIIGKKGQPEDRNQLISDIPDLTFLYLILEMFSFRKPNYWMMLLNSKSILFILNILYRFENGFQIGILTRRKSTLFFDCYMMY